jgi:LAS superfamily LD-carboxypeptidase LdcB
MVSAAKDDGMEPDVLQIHSAYRSVAWQRHIFDYWVEERRKKREEDGLEALTLSELHKLQTPWTAAPGTSAHHTGFALDLKLYELGKRGSKRHPAYAWLANNARLFGFYPYFPEGWHWEYNPPGLIPQIVALRAALRDGKPFDHLLEAPQDIPVAVAAR